MSNLPLSNQVRPDATLEELKMTKQGWLDMARQAGYPEICWEIVRWLGALQKTRTLPLRGTTWIWQNNNVSVIGSEYVQVFNTTKSDYQYLRRFTVWLKNAKPGVVYRNEIDNIVLNSVSVMNWEWIVFYDKKTALPSEIIDGDGCNFVNGSWILSVRDFIGQAQAAKEAHNLANTDLERKRLMDEMLVGVSV